VHTLGTLFEGHAGEYKKALRQGDILGAAGSIFGASANPLKNETRVGTYEKINRDSGPSRELFHSLTI
jgi:hypothetical protein